VEVADDGELLFEGPNACVGFWDDGALTRRDPDRTVHTSDLVRRDGEDLYFRGRKDDAFKLSNGRLVRAGAVEATLKTTHPGLHDALVFTPDGDDVAVALCADEPAEETPSEAAVREALGSLGKRLVWTTTVSPDVWRTRPKGTVDREAMTTTLTETYQSG
jgi:long-subunit acyl-CoA synthetase (AMP-forming)